MPRNEAPTSIVNSATSELEQPATAAVRDMSQYFGSGNELPRATHTGSFEIGDITVECAVLEDGTRLLTQRGFFVSLGRHKNPSRGQASIDNRPAFLAAKNLETFIPDALREIWAPIPFFSRGGYRGNMAFGYKAEMFPMVCNVYLDAADAGALHRNQLPTVERCRLLVRGLAAVGIVALVDEATGYQQSRDRDALQKILAAYISPELLPWTKRFPDEFYEHMFRLWDWTYRPLSVKRPRHVGRLTSQLVYEKLPPGVLEELRRRNPADESGRRKRKHHQLLTEDIGNPHLEKHLAVVTALMRISPNRRTFERHFERAFPSAARQLELIPDMVDEDEDIA